jgi:hypothetical protein
MIQDAAAVATGNRNPVRANRAFIKLTMTLYCDIVANMRNRPLGASTCLRRYAPFAGNSGEQRQNSGRRRCSCIRQTVRGPGFPRGKEMSTADKLPQKQRKQREVHCAFGFVQLMNASEH